MNFLLHMIGQSHRFPAGLRPSGAARLRAKAASAAAAGRLEDALAAYRRLASESRGSISDSLITAHLHLALQEYSAAFACFTAAINRAGDPPLLTLEQTIDAADDHLRSSRYIRAADLLQHARTSVDTLLAAHAGLAVAAARLSTPTPCALGSILPLTKLGDLLLRMLARTQLASNLAASLRERSLRDDLAPWATSGASIDNLLRSELHQLENAAKKEPSHAELHYRLALVARTLGILPRAAEAFTRVLALHPHHTPSAARLAATLLQLKKTQAIFPILAVAFAVPPNILQQYASLASAAQTGTFDRAADQLCQLRSPHEFPLSPTSIKANLAFALSELGLLDPARAEWREFQPV